MSNPSAHFELPPQICRDDGGTRRVGFELEFSGIDLDAAVGALRSSLGAELKSETAAERVLEVESLGEFAIELDWAYLKSKADEKGRSASQEEWIERLSQAAALVVPVEVVCPPIPITELAVLDPMVEALREAGAVGTEESLLAAYGVHVNPEIPSLDAATLHAFIRAFALLQWWLVKSHAIDATRRLSPYVDIYPAAYVQRVLSEQSADLHSIIDTYLEHNATRNRALDLLPLLAEIDPERVRAEVDDDRIKPRPTFHYRMPNCNIEREGWSLARSWNTWCVVEKLAGRTDQLDSLAAEFLKADRFLLGVHRARWVEFVDQWLKERELV